jgi:hypothetical protein
MKNNKTIDIEQKAIRERLLFKKYIKNLDISFFFNYTPYSGNEQHDVTYIKFDKNYKVKKVIAEIKVRDIPFEVLKGGFMIEKKKYDYLMSQKEIYNEINYIMILPDGIFVWDLLSIEAPEFKVENQRKNNYSDEKINKEVGYLHFGDTSYRDLRHIKTTKYLKDAIAIHNRINKNL